MKRLAQIVAPPTIALALGLSLWQAAVRIFDVPAFLLPPPSDIAGAAWSNADSLAQATLTTFETALAGFALSAVVGVSAAVLLSLSRLLERAIYPYTVFLQTVPIVAIAPLLVLWLGPGFNAVAVSALIVSVFPVIASTLTGLGSVPPELRDLFRLYGASRLDRLLKLELPSAVPFIVTGLRVASGLSVIGAIVGEFVAGFAEGSAGLGITVLTAYRQLRTDLLFAAVFSASFLGFALFGGVSFFGRLLLRRFDPSTKS